MPKEVLYLKLEQNAELSGESVHISDLGKLYCRNRKACRIDAERFLFSDLRKKIRGAGWLARFLSISLLQQDNPNLEVESIGAPETVVEQVKVVVVIRASGRCAKSSLSAASAFLAQRLRSWRFITTSGFARCSGKFTSF